MGASGPYGRSGEADAASPVRVAVIDSGVHAAHPHLAGGSIEELGIIGDRPPFRIEDAAPDRSGHGTAVAAAIARVEPAVELICIGVLDAGLQATGFALARAMELAAERGAQVVNMSLGTASETAAAELDQAVAALVDSGIIPVSIMDPRGLPTRPGCCDGVLVAHADRSLPPGEVRSLPALGPLHFRAHPYARPPRDGAPPARGNFAGPSLAAATLSGRCARLIRQGFSGDSRGIAEVLASSSRPGDRGGLPGNRR